MNSSRAQFLAWEERWSPRGAAAAAAAVVLVAISLVFAAQVGGGDGNAEFLRNVNDDSAARLIAGVLQGIGVGLLAVPLFVLFTAVRRRSDSVRGGFVRVIVAAPIFLGIASILAAVSTVDAADDFVSNHLPRLVENGVALGSDRADEVADDALADASWRLLATGFGVGGQIGFMFAMFYTGLHAMRTGLLTRFWGSLGMALGIASFVPDLFQFAVLWFVYLALLFVGKVPGGKPPAWSAGEAIPWPTPGEKAAEGLEEEKQPDEEEPRQG